ncbi:choline transporter-like protein 1 [Onthophagus taurus]|uniref:choline transporter-like protein 1 n=1 Tax=Onthophagus taurus TaxID=166361 RepID=UPI0039BE73DA
MGSSISLTDKVQPQEIPFGNNPEESETHPKKDRQCTDIFFLILMSLALIVLIILSTYCIFYGNIYRILYGYNDCADVCGIQNFREKDLKFECKGSDMKFNKYLMILNASDTQGNSNGVTRVCVSSCYDHPGYRELFHRCIPEKSTLIVNQFVSKLGWNDFFQEAAEDLGNNWKEILYLCLIGLVFSLVLVLLLRFFVGFLVWTVVIGVALASIIGTINLWILYSQIDNDINNKSAQLVSIVESTNKWSILSFAIIVTIITVCVVVLIIALRNRIKLVVQLFKEAGKAIASMPLLLLQPFLTLFSLAVVMISWLYLALWIQSAGHLTYIRQNFFVYLADTPMKIARFWNFFLMLWMCQFVIGCQHMVLAGAVSTWYFTRNKSNLGDPILYSHYNLMKYHLGSISFGSLLIATIMFVRLLLAFLQKQLVNKTNSCAKYMLKCCQCCLYCFEKLLKYISRNAYIEIAMYGQNFYNSGKRAFQILTANSLRVAVINSVGDFVLFLGKVLVVLATVFIGIEIFERKEGVQHIWVPLFVVAIFTYYIAHCFITVYEMAIDTIFLCFCEDCSQNDGLSKPYYMSKGLMSFVENSKKIIEESKTKSWA